MDLIKYVQETYIDKKDFPSFKAGDTITVYYKIVEGEKTRTQFFRGDVIQRSGAGATETFTIRKMSGAIGVERSRLRAKGYGASRPVASNQNEEGRSRNRRTAFEIVP